MCLYISFWTSFFSCSPHGNILLKPWDKFCWEVRMSMLIFFPLLRRLSLTEAPVPSPMVTTLSVKEACSVSCLLSFAIRHWGTSPHQAALRTGRPQHLGDVLISSEEKCLPSEPFTEASETHSQYSAVIVMLVFWWMGVVAAYLQEENKQGF